MNSQVFRPLQARAQPRLRQKDLRASSPSHARSLDRRASRQRNRESTRSGIRPKGIPQRSTRVSSSPLFGNGVVRTLGGGSTVTFCDPVNEWDSSGVEASSYTLHALWIGSGEVPSLGNPLQSSKEASEMKMFALELILKTMHFLQDVTLSCRDDLSSFDSSTTQLLTKKCGDAGERALEKFRFNLERKDWKLEKDYGEEGITIKSVFDQETKTHFLLTEALLDFDCDWVFRDLKGHTLAATADWYADVMEYKIVQRLTDDCWVVYQVTEPKLGGLFAGRDMVILVYFGEMRDSKVTSFVSTTWPGLEPRKKMVRAEMQEGGGISLSPDQEQDATRTRLRWVSSLDFKIPFVPSTILQKLYADGCRNYIIGLRKYLSTRHQLHLQDLQD
ncbi:unnamed protein product [Darwinula stevensoni]|uniref:START domain-containing protein n=1 Tax=Darwinula stevensoni TaxID=69355 RepID=A0A7R9AEE0_9CRUS|nr:unnamed protein product [Darwinula stevensoni]CAG0901479.1 unnamed protein product [Darwinula stevensoni]